MKKILPVLCAIMLVGLSACTPSASDVKKALAPLTPPAPAQDKLLQKIKNQEAHVLIANQDFNLGVGYAMVYTYQDGAKRYDIDLSKSSVSNCQKSFDFDSGAKVNFNFPIDKEVVSGFDFSVQLSGFGDMGTKYITGDKVIKIEKADSQEIIGSVYVMDADGNQINGRFKAELCTNRL